ncbi:hypothetical protein HLB44_21265 [Aquincola sp. S2]|uniref:Glycerate kinase n=1 Tax=Pseudaquabacterium terrae TaxID=2732868 RepID=A0ABX2ELK3_9BURK|nr:hypothetical protein [Aquabacterium terrae]NRF69537.1 hypothetical protein [Aquabacterium terrae]
MNALIGWGLAAVATALGYAVYGWPGVALAASVMVFWLLLQFSRAMRVMRLAGQAPVGRVASAVMLQSQLRKGQRLMELLALTRSLGEKLRDEPETYRWTDPGGAAVTVELHGGRLSEWHFTRPPDAAAAADAGA